ncbi:uncharacterized protein K452DRAFT_273441 [Aplosporella prunicola CBS 121167]|uniref:DUF1760-domain-containing protein n=1 Tax=Aplosporella prunicola CBS 121167 TaxID=1176127 RepID=A0A6A6BBR5_9PEZI|nr:uncharacterized protein K452DRAFT_273441 [Aplosporella prunicola CBS 121167]KAF2140694.1 hypothetical protein K452DRAFT_273441 [Aplosporella prunicola CBS 121167]
MTEEEHPFIAGRPPVMDHLTYLTLVEHNLTPELLPTLHTVLQDPELTTNIGWDLVHLLLPLLPASEQCLQDIARLGNPREVVLKVTESLRLLDFESIDQDEEEETHPLAGDSAIVSDDESVKSKAQDSVTSKADDKDPKTPLPILQFEALLSMLAVLHPRIRTKYPSRFLSTSLQAVLSSYSEAGPYATNLTPAVTKLVKTLSGTKRPHLPPRTSSFSFAKATLPEIAADPEASKEPTSQGDDELQNKLLQSFLTHILEDYMLSLSSPEDVPALAWTARVHEKLHPERKIPNKMTYAERFNEDEPLVERSGIVGQLAALARDLDIPSEDLYAAITDTKPEPNGLPSEEDEPPSTADDIPLSKTGSLFLFTARKISEVLYNLPLDAQDLYIFPEHATIMENFLSMTPGNIGTEPEALIDTLLTLGILAIEKNMVGEPADDEYFAKYLQTTSLLSANSPSPTLRYHAHYLTSTVLRSHPSDIVRLSFIRDTLEHCPYENLKASAVGWLKGETVEANMKLLSAAQPAPAPSIFSTPVALATVSPFLFPDLSYDLTAPSLLESWSKFKMELSFYLATLNFYYLLLSAKPLHKALDVHGLHANNDIGGSYLHPLRQVATTFRKGMAAGGELRIEEGEQGVQAGEGDLRILEDALDRVEKGVVQLNVE